MNMGSVGSAASSVGSAAGSASGAGSMVGNLGGMTGGGGGLPTGGGNMSGGSIPGMSGGSGGGLPTGGNMPGGGGGSIPGMGGGSSSGGLPGMGGNSGQGGLPGMGGNQAPGTQQGVGQNDNPLGDLMSKAPQGQKLKPKMEPAGQNGGTPAPNNAGGGKSNTPNGANNNGSNPEGNLEEGGEPQGPPEQKKDGGKKVYEDENGNEYREGDKVSPGREVGKDGEVKDSSTKKLTKTAGRAVAAYYTGGESLNYDREVLNNGMVDKAIGVVTDAAEKAPGVKQVSDELEEAGVTDTVDDALNVIGDIKKGDYAAIAQDGEKLKEDGKKLSKYTFKQTLKITLISCIPLFIVIIATICVLGPVIGGFIDITDQISEKVDQVLDFFGDLFDGLSPEVAMSEWVEGFDSLPYEAQRIVTVAASLVGRPYYWGGKPSGPGFEGVPSTGLDCSGYVAWVMWTAYGENPGFLSTYSIDDLGAQGKRLIPISESELRPGDIGLRTVGEGQHTGIYAGNGYWFHAAGKAYGIVRGQYNSFNKYFRYVSTNPVPTATGVYSDWRQGGSSWSNITLGKSGKSIGRIGCLVTSIAKQIARSGVPTGNVVPFNPGTFVQALNRVGGFTDGGALYWGAVSKVVPNFVLAGNFDLKGKTQQAKLSTIAQYNNQGYYLVCEVKGATANSQHWVAVMGTTGSTVVMSDPASNSTDMWAKYDWQKTTGCRYFKANK